MSCEQFRKFIDSLTARELSDWSKKQTVLARGLRKGLSNRLKIGDTLKSTPIELPDDEAIVDATIARILSAHDEGYVWDRTGTLDQFFRRCMRRTMEALRSEERRHRNGSKKLQLPVMDAGSIQPQPILDTFFRTPQPDNLELAETEAHRIATSPDQFRRVLTSTLGKNRMGTILRTYAERLP
jgi:hypothetical protein